MTEDQASVESLTTETIIADDPHAVLVEFSSVVADTQEYIIKVSRKGSWWDGRLRDESQAEDSEVYGSLKRSVGSHFYI